MATLCLPLPDKDEDADELNHDNVVDDDDIDDVCIATNTFVPTRR